MGISEMIAAVDAEIARLQRVRDLLADDGDSELAPTIPRMARTLRISQAAESGVGSGRRVLSAEARERIAIGQRKRWAAAKKADRRPVRQ